MARYPTTQVGYLVQVDEKIGQVLAAALDGDADAWDQLVDEYVDLLWWVARTWRMNDADAADLVQTVWLKLLQHGSSISDPSRLAAWLATTARREATSRINKQRREEPTSEAESFDIGYVPEADEPMLETETVGEAIAAFHGLDRDCQQLLGLLCEVPRKPYGEIAALLSKSIGWIGPTRQRCLAKLRALMPEGGVRYA